MALILGVMLAAGAGGAQAPAPGTLRLTESEKAALLAQSDEQGVDAARAGLAPSDAPRRGVHGEMGAMIGSNGAHALYGTAAIPIGQSGGAIISVESSRFPRPR
ncbi:hypothetical protein [Sphingomonas morindae]|uniref:Uncharacterized protein n=1 Tax=Sphingomonas morindae TaxID=1541170 RepID=A0ABY4X6T2_9SPHN|nr:hypothetical protein [Sphingomonas morindae]USI72638.1 hypothetical protein LHA26_15350 [Sphingomonas morindae]